jgi:hypothetical protein
MPLYGDFLNLGPLDVMIFVLLITVRQLPKVSLS